MSKSRRIFLSCAAVLCLGGTAAEATVLDPAYGVAATAQVYTPEGLVTDETCVGNGDTFNPCVIMQNAAISGDGTSASALIDQGFWVPAGDNAFLLEQQHAAASADLATGEIHMDYSGPYPTNAAARYEDILYFDPASFSGDSAIITFTITLEGTFADSNIGYLFQAGGFDDSLVASTAYYGQGLQQVQDIADPLNWLALAEVGDWTVFGPNIFEGQVTVTAENPFLLIESELTGCCSFVDFADTAHLDMTLPEGLQYTSASGVFLTAAGVPGVPEPATWAMMLLGFGAVGIAARKARHSGRRELLRSGGALA